MKKLTFLFAIVIAVLTFTSCEPEIVNPETQKTEAFNIYEYATTTDFVVGMDTVVNDTTYTLVIDTLRTDIVNRELTLKIETKNDSIGYAGVMFQADTYLLIYTVIGDVTNNYLYTSTGVLYIHTYYGINEKYKIIYDEVTGEFLRKETNF